VVARLVRLQRRVEVVTSAATVLGTGGDPRSDVLDRLATVATDADDRLVTVLEQIRTHRRVDLVVAVLGSVGGDVTRALAGLAGIEVIAVLTQPVRLAPSSSLVVVDASTTPFPVAWNRACSQAARGGAAAPSRSSEHGSAPPPSSRVGAAAPSRSSEHGSAPPPSSRTAWSPAPASSRRPPSPR